MENAGFLPGAPHQRLASWAAGAMLGLWAAGCLVTEKCYSDADCPAAEVCSVSGDCKLQCREDSDCDGSFGSEYVCDDHRCKMPVACTLCSFEHAESSCVHGSCTMGACLEGFYDLNQDDTDGCEYACVASASSDSVEPCDGSDNDCDGLVDEDTALDSDLFHCGACDNVCPERPNADPLCAAGECRIVCHEGWYDNDHDPENGCEDEECIPAAETCDGKDNDCDCPGDTNSDAVVCGPGDEGVDEGFDKSLPTSCGAFCVVCSFPHAEALCAQGECQLGPCSEGWFDVDAIAANGCEVRCTPTGDGVELCDGLDNDCDGEVDEGCDSPCPPEMVAVGSAFCIDRYEASRSDATETFAGTDDSVALSQPGVLPWMVNPMTLAHMDTFRAACAASGKRLCGKDEWFAACTGPDQTPYVYGATFDREACNCVDTYCDDYCQENGIEVCSTAENCGYTYNCFHEDPTGSFPGCTNEYGTFDINGNVWEVVPSETDVRGYEVRGGAFNCASPVARVSCAFNAGWSALYAGFRCCKDPS